MLEPAGKLFAALYENFVDIQVPSVLGIAFSRATDGNKLASISNSPHKTTYQHLHYPFYIELTSNNVSFAITYPFSATSFFSPPSTSILHPHLPKVSRYTRQLSHSPHWNHNSWKWSFCSHRVFSLSSNRYSWYLDRCRISCRNRCYLRNSSLPRTSRIQSMHPQSNTFLICRALLLVPKHN